MTNPNKRLVAVLLDRSGSMQTIKADMQGGFDTFIEEQRKNRPENVDISVTLAQFDTTYEVVYSSTPLDEVPPLRLDPRGGTALYDSVAKLTNDIGAELAALDDSKRPSGVLIVIITDGHENSSREYNNAAIRTLIAQQENEWQWTYVFLGANMDAVATGQGFGISSHTHSLTYNATEGGTRGAFAGLSRATTKWSEQPVGAGSPDFSFTDEDRSAAEEK